MNERENLHYNGFIGTHTAWLMCARCIISFTEEGLGAAVLVNYPFLAWDVMHLNDFYSKFDNF